jgi:hypothetical protein
VQLVAIKDLLWRCRALWFFAFECKRILRLSAFLLLSVAYLMSVIDHRAPLSQVFHLLTLTTTHCLEFIRTSLFHAYLVWFLS